MSGPERQDVLRGHLGVHGARAVKEEIIESLGRILDGGEVQAVKLLGKIQRLGRYSVEAWG